MTSVNYQWHDNLRCSFQFVNRDGSLTERYTRQATSSDILQAFGLKPTSFIPVYYSAGMRLGNVRVRIQSQEAMHIFHQATSGRAPLRRVIAECPRCNKWVCAGHLRQHMKCH